MTRRGFLAALVAVPAAVKAMATGKSSPWDGKQFKHVPETKEGQWDYLGFKSLGSWTGVINGHTYFLVAYDMGDKCSLCRIEPRGSCVELCPLDKKTDRVSFYECSSGVIIVCDGNEGYPFVFIGDHVRGITALDKETALLKIDPFTGPAHDEFELGTWHKANVGSREFRVRELGVPSAEGVPGRRDYVTARKARARLWDTIIKSGTLNA